MRPQGPMVGGEFWQLEVVEGRRVDRDGLGGRPRKYDLLGVGGGGREKWQGQ